MCRRCETLYGCLHSQPSRITPCNSPPAPLASLFGWKRNSWNSVMILGPHVDPSPCPKCTEQCTVPAHKNLRQFEEASTHKRAAEISSQYENWRAKLRKEHCGEWLKQSLLARRQTREAAKWQAGFREEHIPPAQASDRLNFAVPARKRSTYSCSSDFTTSTAQGRRECARRKLQKKAPPPTYRRKMPPKELRVDTSQGYGLSGLVSAAKALLSERRKAIKSAESLEWACRDAKRIARGEGTSWI